jgi:glycosyltransferase involved in cell wall biosynthesis
MNSIDGFANLAIQDSRVAIATFPMIKSQSEFHDTIARLTWYFHHTDSFEVYVPISSMLNTSFETPHGFDTSIEQLFHQFKSGITLVICDEPPSHKNLTSFDGICCLKKSELSGLNSNLSLPIADVDPYNSRGESSNYYSLQFHLSQEKQEWLNDSLAVFEKLKEQHGGSKYCHLLATGPSIEKYRDFDFSNSITIGCNSVIKNQDLLKTTHLDILTFADPIFHFGCSQYAEEFRKLLAKRIKEHNFFVVIPLKYYGSIVHSYPELKDRVIGIPLASSKLFALNLSESFTAPGHPNILTLFMIPLASTLAKHVYFVGCDGRPISQSGYFWSHNSSTQIDEKMQNIQQVHPGFFKLNYNDYYKEHCQNLNLYLRELELNGKIVVSLTKSFIPCLAKRYFGERSKSVADKNQNAHKVVVSINPDLKDKFGHFLGFDLALANESKKSGVPYISLCHSDAKVSNQEPVELLPTFSKMSWNVYSLTSEQILDQFKNELKSRLLEIRNRFPRAHLQIVMYLSSEYHYRAILEIAAQFSDPEALSFHLNLFHLQRNSTKNETLKPVNSFNFDIIKSCHELGRHLSVFPYFDTEKQALLFFEKYGLSFPAWPMIGTSHFEQSPTKSSQHKTGNYCVYFPSNMQATKGYDMIPKIARTLLDRGLAVTCKARVIVRDDTPAEARRVASDIRKHCTPLEGLFSERDFQNYLEEADIVVLPYRKEAFWGRTSGILVDCFQLEKPVVTTANTWAGDQVDLTGFGQTFVDGSIKDAADAIESTIKSLQTSELDSSKVSDWLEKHTPKVFFERLERESTGIQKLPRVAQQVLADLRVLEASEAYQTYMHKGAFNLVTRVKDSLSSYPHIYEPTKNLYFTAKKIRSEIKRGRDFILNPLQR